MLVHFCTTLVLCSVTKHTTNQICSCTKSVKMFPCLYAFCFLELYLKLEDVTRRFVRPCIMDVKIGRKSYDPFASQEKREEHIRKYPLMDEIGFLILGMRVRPYMPFSISNLHGHIHC